MCATKRVKHVSFLDVCPERRQRTLVGATLNVNLHILAYAKGRMHRTRDNGRQASVRGDSVPGLRLRSHGLASGPAEISRHDRSLALRVDGRSLKIDPASQSIASKSDCHSVQTNYSMRLVVGHSMTPYACTSTRSDSSIRVCLPCSFHSHKAASRKHLAVLDGSNFRQLPARRVNQNSGFYPVFTDS